MMNRTSNILVRHGRLVAGAIAVAVIFLGTAQAYCAVMDSTLVEDAYISADGTESNTNFSGSTVLKLRTTTSVWRNALIQFDLPLLPVGESVVKVELILTSASNTSGVGGTPDIEVLATTAAIDLSTVTYNSANPSLHSGGAGGTSALVWSGVWSDFTADGLIPGADFSVSQTVNYTDDDDTQGLLKFVQDNISEVSNTNLTVGLGFVIREGNDGTTSLGWDIASQEVSGSPILRITTAAAAVPEPASLGLLAIGGLLIAGRRQR